jgi:hypothetical protein
VRGGHGYIGCRGSRPGQPTAEIRDAIFDVIEDDPPMTVRQFFIFRYGRATKVPELHEKSRKNCGNLRKLDSA